LLTIISDKEVKMSIAIPKYDEICNLEEDILSKRWQIIRYAIAHNGEKGFAAEYEVQQLIRSILPNEYGITTGFIIYQANPNYINDNKSEPELTKQLDIIIYDAIKCTPLIRLGSCDVVPIEAVYAYIEIKGCLYKNQIKEIVQDSGSIRNITKRYYYETAGSTNAILKVIGESNENAYPIRAYVICLDSQEGLQADDVKIELEKNIKEIGGNSFISGMLVSGNSFLFSHSVNSKDKNDIENKDKVYLLKDKPLMRFKWRINEDLSRFFRIPSEWTPALEIYSGNIINHNNYPSASAPTIIH